MLGASEDALGRRGRRAGAEAATVEDALGRRRSAARGRQPNLSFFAFTATPKGRTLELFGRYDPATERHEPFHLYSMRQAIEEGFILDVLANYITYKTYWKIEQATPDDPDVRPAPRPRQRSPGSCRCTRTTSRRRPRSSSSTSEPQVRHKIGGRAKAMVVTASRAARRPLQAGARQVHQRQGLLDVGVLVAFSGRLDLDGGDDSPSRR